MDFKIKMVKRDEDHYVMIRGSIHQEDMTIVNIYVPQIRVHKYIKQILTELKVEMKSNIMIVGTLIPHSQKWIDHPVRESTRKQ